MLPNRFKVAVSVNMIIEKDSKYLLLRRAKTGWADGFYTLPAGHIDGAEQLRKAAIRETLEEVGLAISIKELKLVHIMHRSNKEDDQERLDFYFLIKNWKGEPHIGEPDKADDMGWFEIDDLPEETLKNVKFVLGIYKDKLLSEVNW